MRLLRVGAALAALGILGLLVAASGLIPIKASTGHWAVTRWFLSFTMRRSVVTHTMTMAAPPLDDPGLVLKGAGHYELECMVCHGSPALPPARFTRSMTPDPPFLLKTVTRWEPEELFYIVKHGIKFTAMPAWPSQERDDEVWAMVAFLRALPGLDAAAYRRLAHGDSGTAAHRCERCHGPDGVGRGAGTIPRLAGQSPAYLAASLEAYARRQRHSGIMELVAAKLTPEEMRELGRDYGGVELARQPSSGPSEKETSAIERGAAIARRGVPAQRVPSCIPCHGPGPAPRNPIYPTLVGQYADYLALQLELFKKGHRGGTAYAHLMQAVVRELTPEQMRDVARYYASLSQR
jgi:cytochrome c553